MPWIRPSLSNLLDRCRGDIETNLPGADARLRRSNLGVLAGVVAALAHGLYGALDWLSRQILPFDAEGDELDRHAAFWLAEPRKAAEPAVGQITVAGTDGAVVEAGSVWVRSDGAEFAADAEAIVAGGSATVAVTAVEPGAAGNTDAAAPLTPALPIAGVQSAVVAASGLTLGADAESDDELRSRLLARPKQPPHGGAAFDYVSWALEVSGVTRAWCYPREQGDGTVTVRFVRDNDANIIPDAAAVVEVQNYIDGRCPVTAEVFVAAPVALPLDFVFAAITPNTQTVRDGVAAALADLISREAEPGGTLPISRIRATISTAPGVSDYVLTSPAADVATGTGQMTTQGEVTWP